MKRSVSIPRFQDINECHEASGFPVRTDLPDFHIFTMEETYPATRQAMPPYRRGFHQITFLETLGTAIIRHESAAFTGNQSVLLFSSPDHLLSWVCGGHEQGYMLYFRSELLVAGPGQLEDEFPFFGLTSVNLQTLSAADRAKLVPQLQVLHALYHSTHAYRLPKLAALTRAFLYDCRALLEERTVVELQEQPKGSLLVKRFLEMVAQCFQEHCSVEQYAACLHVSADHLSAAVKERTGRNARDIVAERVVLEAKRLLTHTDLTISEISDHLQFSEPTHFARFFRRYAERSPLEFRRGLPSRATTGPRVAVVSA